MADGLRSALLRARLELLDALRYSKLLRAAIAASCRLAWQVLAWTGLAPGPRLRLLLMAARRGYPRLPSPGMVAGFASEGTALRHAWVTTREPREPVEWSIILKAPDGDERGVLLVAFEPQWMRLLRQADLAALRRDYDLVLAPTWSPPYDEEMLTAAALWEAPLSTQLSNLADLPAYAALAPNLRPVSLLAASWVHPDLIRPVANCVIERDLVVLANFAAYKRHFDLFRAMAQLRRTPSVLCIGFPHEGRDVGDLEREAAAWGVADAVEFRVRVSEAELCALVSGSRAAVMMSRAEGSLVAVADLLWLDRPVGLRADAHVGTKAFITPETGVLLRPGHIADDIQTLLDRSEGLHPRAWMTAHGHAARNSSTVLEAHLRTVAAERAGAWRVGCAPLCTVRNVPRYLDADDHARLTPAYAAFEAAYGVSLGDPERRSPPL